MKRGFSAIITCVLLSGTGLLTGCGGNPVAPTTTTEKVKPMTTIPPATKPAPLMPATPGTVRAETAHSRSHATQ